MTRKNFFIDITLLDSFSKQFLELIPSQRRVVEQLMNDSKIISYSLSLDRSKLWIVAEGANDEEILDMLSEFPLIKFMRPDVHELAFHDNIHSGFPHLSLN